MAKQDGVLRIEYWPIGKAALWDDNPKEHDIGSLITSIQQYGFRDAVIYDQALNDGQGGIVAGNGRITALVAMQSDGRYDIPDGILADDDGQWMVPVQVGINSVNQEEAERFGWDHNSLTVTGGNTTIIDLSRIYDTEKATALLSRLQEYGKMPITTDIDDLRVIEKLRDGALPIGHSITDPPVPDTTFEPVTHLGSFDIPGIYLGDCVTLMRDLPSECIDLTVTSPPYDDLRDYEPESNLDFEACAMELWRITKPGGVVVWVISDQTIDQSETGSSFRQALYFKEVGFLLYDTMIYHKNFLPQSHRRYEQAFEYMFVFSKGPVKTFTPIMVDKHKLTNKPKVGIRRREADGSPSQGFISTSPQRMRSNVWFYAIGRHSAHDRLAFKHPAIMPENLARDHIVTWSRPGDLVFDPMAGSGTTLKMAQAEGRNWLGFEVVDKYVDIAKVRLVTITQGTES